MLGGNYFDINNENYTINLINNFVTSFKLENIWYAITLYVYLKIIMSITCNDCSKKLSIYGLLCMLIVIPLQYCKNYIGILGIVLDYVYLLLLSIGYIKLNKRKVKSINIKNYITIMLMYTLVQIFSMVIRGQNLLYIVDNFYINFILNLDVLLLMIIIYKLYFMRGDESLCQMVVSYGSQKLTSLKRLLEDSHVKSQSKPKLTKEDKITYMIYIPLYFLWNMFTMLIIVLIAILNDAMIEALFITISFWINKRVFGKPFHFKSVSICFCFSSIVYYVLTRITFSIETSIFVPIMLGVLLSYGTSTFIKKNYKLYKGMDQLLFNETIRQVTDDELVIKMCKEYYCDRLSDIKISTINNYSIDSVRKKRQKINKELRNLEK